MTAQAHVERHFRANATVRDIVIGMSDGLTVPFALAAGISGVAGAETKIVVLAGLAEIATGSIAMGLGGGHPDCPVPIWDIKGSFTGTKPLRSGFQTVLVGGLAAGAAFLLARLIG